ncbi:MAG TPA: hypothetical protein VGN69_10745 [Solirubrobacteraceae bacterium]|nr:hypothetical protein [Solirubrobacteraceae bacterium]
MSDDEPTTSELRDHQARRERDERRRAEVAEDPDDTHSHERRADKAAYLRDKLIERERAEDPPAGDSP